MHTTSQARKAANAASAAIGLAATPSASSSGRLVEPSGIVAVGTAKVGLSQEDESTSRTKDAALEVA